MSNEKQNSDKDRIISSLQMEYNSHRMEIRDLMKAIDNIIGATFLGVLVSEYGQYINKTEILYIIPSIIFVAFSMYVSHVSSASVHETYCNTIEARYKELLVDDKNQSRVLLNFGKKYARLIGAPDTPTQQAIYVVNMFFLCLFFVVAFMIFSKWAYAHPSGWSSLFNLKYRHDPVFWINYMHITEMSVIVYLIIKVISPKPMTR